MKDEIAEPVRGIAQTFLDAVNKLETEMNSNW